MSRFAVRVLLITLLSATIARAGGPVVSTAADGDWSNTATWDGGVIPGPGDTAQVVHDVSITAAVTAPGNTTIGAGASAGSVAVLSDGLGGGIFVANGTLELADGTLDGFIDLQGIDAQALMLVTGGSVDIGSFIVGRTAGETGSATLEMRGGGSSVASLPFRLNATGTLRLRPAGPDASDLTTIAATNLTFGTGSTVELDVTDYAPLVGDEWDIVSYSGTLSGTPTNLTAPPGYLIAIDDSVPGVITLRVTASALLTLHVDPVAKIVALTGDDSGTAAFAAGSGGLVSWDTGAAITAARELVELDGALTVSSTPATTLFGPDLLVDDTSGAVNVAFRVSPYSAGQIIDVTGTAVQFSYAALSASNQALLEGLIGSRLQRESGIPSSFPALAVVGFVDTDSDGIPDGADNCRAIANATQQNSDGDSHGDACDNCTLVDNEDQCNTNAPDADPGDLGDDNFGNACDTDLDNNGTTNSFDLALMRAAFGASGANDADFSCDDVVNSFDLNIMRVRFGQPPGPSGL